MDQNVEEHDEDPAATQPLELDSDGTQDVWDQPSTPSNLLFVTTFPSLRNNYCTTHFICNFKDTDHPEVLKPVNTALKKFATIALKDNSQ